MTDFLPIGAYGVIGDLRTTAHVGVNGSIDWLCWPLLDSPSVFAAILDPVRGGRFQVHLPEGVGFEQEYLPSTKVLVTRFRQGDGVLEVTDFMPIAADISGVHSPPSPQMLIRILRCLAGDVDVEVAWSPRFDYGRAPTKLEATTTAVHATASSYHLVLEGLPCLATIDSSEYGGIARSRFRMSVGDVVPLTCSEDGIKHSPESALTTADQCVDSWRRWASKDEMPDRSWAQQYSSLLRRSELAIKLLIRAETGAIAAAATTSLPESKGHGRNWDYRYVWIRDASMTAQSLVGVGHQTEASDFLAWMDGLLCTAKSNGGLDLHIMYGLDGATYLPEETLGHLRGYRDSRPVRIGNEAAEQTQLDAFGELISINYELSRGGLPLSESAFRMVVRAADEIARRWREPDHGIWEIRGGCRHYTHSKMMSWVALDHAILLSQLSRMEGWDTRIWLRERDAIFKDLCANGIHPVDGYFTQTYGGNDIDASALLIPLHEFLKPDHPTVLRTIDEVRRVLDSGKGLIHRYRCDDGLAGEEGAFLLCTFWLVDALALAHRLDEAYEVFEAAINCTNHLGLMSEQVHPTSGVALGNFPQAFSHIGMINSLLYLAAAEQRPTPVFHPIGTKGHRQARNEAVPINGQSHHL